MKELSRRTLVRLISFSTAAAAVLIALTAVADYERAQYRRQLEYTYMRSLQDASDFVSNISATLDKGVYAGTPAQMTSLSATLWKDSSAAKASLSSLPISEFDLGNTYRFLSQVGDYSMTLTKKVGQNETLTDEEKENIRKLRDYAGQLNERLSDIERRISLGEISLDQVMKEAAAYQNGAEQPAEGGDEAAADASDANASGFLEMEDGFSGYPSLIYDGPFSDHLLDREPELTQGREEITRDQARTTAANAAMVPADALFDAPDEESKLPCYNFTQENISASVTKNGGFLNYMVNGRAIGEPRISDNLAREKAVEYLGHVGLSSLKETYYEKSDNVMTINYAHYQDGVVCYTDLVKVGVAMDNGEVVFFDARGYIMNHRNRTLPAAEMTPEAAQKSVSAMLEVERHKLALIPTAGKNEVLCYEFYGKGENNDEMLVYVNAQTGAEEQILKLIKNENGILTQ